MSGYHQPAPVQHGPPVRGPVIVPAADQRRNLSSIKPGQLKLKNGKWYYDPNDWHYTLHGEEPQALRPPVHLPLVFFAPSQGYQHLRSEHLRSTKVETAAEQLNTSYVATYILSKSTIDVNGVALKEYVLLGPKPMARTSEPRSSVQPQQGSQPTTSTSGQRLNPRYFQGTGIFGTVVASHRPRTPPAQGTVGTLASNLNMPPARSYTTPTPTPVYSQGNLNQRGVSPSRGGRAGLPNIPPHRTELGGRTLPAELPSQAPVAELPDESPFLRELRSRLGYYNHGQWYYRSDSHGLVPVYSQEQNERDATLTNVPLTNTNKDAVLRTLNRQGYNNAVVMERAEPINQAGQTYASNYCLLTKKSEIQPSGVPKQHYQAPRRTSPPPPSSPDTNPNVGKDKGKKPKIGIGEKFGNFFKNL